MRMPIRSAVKERGNTKPLLDRGTHTPGFDLNLLILAVILVFPGVFGAAGALRQVATHVKGKFVVPKRSSVHCVLIMALACLISATRAAEREQQSAQSRPADSTTVRIARPSPPAQLFAQARLPGDCNGDDRIGLEDHDLFATCIAGPEEPLIDVDCACADLDGDADNDLKDWQLLMLQFASAPPDGDGDGVDDQNDLCDGPAIGAMTSLPGCTNLDLVRMPETLLAPVRTRIDFLSTAPLEPESLAELGNFLESAQSNLDDAANATRSGMICESLTPLNDAESDLAIAAELIDEALQTTRASAPEPADGQGDVRDIDLHLATLELLVQRGVEASNEVIRLWTATDRLCRSARPFRGRKGTIVEIIEEEQLMVLDDGTTLQFPEPAGVETDLFPGHTILIDGLEFGDGTGIAGLVAEGEILADPDPVPLSCIRLRFFPVQPFAQSDVSQLIRHDPMGYELNGQYRVEKGMRFGVERTCPPVSVDIGEVFTRHTAVLSLSYTRSTNQQETGKTLAWDLDENDMPVPMPGNVDPAFPAKLSVTYRTQHCVATIVGPDCSEQPSVFAMQEFPLDVFNERGLCFASYADTEFDVNNFVPLDFRSTFVSNVTLLAVSDEGSEPEFRAEGYSAQLLSGGFTTSYPAVVPITAGQEFAIHNFDFYPIHGGAGLQGVYAAIVSGMNRAAGLRWPHVVGVNNGHPFRYSCQVSQIIRDVVNFCPGTNAYYRLPFDQADTFWDQGQANLSDPGCTGDGCPTHANGYAYDMGAPCGSLLRAARGGRVFWVREDKNLQVNKWCCEEEIECLGCETACCSASADSCSHNELWIQHQDGSIGRYVHMPVDGVLPEEGDVVARGEAVGTVGLTGNTSGPHLHFEERRGNATHLALFEVQNPFNPSETITCYEPVNGLPLRSNNHEP